MEIERQEPVTPEQAKEVVYEFHRRYPGIKEFLNPVPDLPTMSTLRTDVQCPSVDENGKRCVFDAEPAHRFHSAQVPEGPGCTKCPNWKGPGHACACRRSNQQDKNREAKALRDEADLNRMAYALRALSRNSNITSEQHDHLVTETYNLLVTLEMFDRPEHRLAWLRNARLSLPS